MSTDALFPYGVFVEYQPDTDTWTRRLTAAAGRRVREQRDRLGLSAQELSSRTAQLGHEVKRSVIAQMETGRRPVLPIADLYVLARALNVPPLMLLLDVGAEEGVEVLPGEIVSNWEAADWIGGTHPLPGRSGPWSADAEADEIDWNAAGKPLARRATQEVLSEIAHRENRELRVLLDTAQQTKGPMRLASLRRLEGQLQRCNEALVDYTHFKQSAAADGFDLPEIEEPDSYPGIMRQASAWIRSVEQEFDMRQSLEPKALPPEYAPRGLG